MQQFDDMSRDELLKTVKAMAEALLRQGNDPQMRVCSFCLGTGYISALKSSVKQHLMDEWSKPVTQEEYEAYVDNLQASFLRKG